MIAAQGINDFGKWGNSKIERPRPDGTFKRIMLSRTRRVWQEQMTLQDGDRIRIGRLH
jgi:hypothetical protein